MRPYLLPETLYSLAAVRGKLQRRLIEKKTSIYKYFYSYSNKHGGMFRNWQQASSAFVFSSSLTVDDMLLLSTELSGGFIFPQRKGGY